MVLVFSGTMRAHTDVVTAIATPIDNSNMIVTASRDKSIILWHLTNEEKTYGVPLHHLTDHSHHLTKEEKTYGVPLRHLTGHSHFVQDVVLSSDSQFALSGSSDGELRLWNLNDGTTFRQFIGHTKEVLSVAFSNDNRKIVSASSDHTIKLWNTLGECKYTIHDAHSDRVSCVRFNPNNILEHTIVSASWDKTLKVWNMNNCKLSNNFVGHSEYVNTIAISPDGSLCASGGKDGVIRFWDLSEERKKISHSFDVGCIIHALCYRPNRYWLCAATEHDIKIWDLEDKGIVQVLKVNLNTEEDELATTNGGGDTTTKKKKVIYCTSLNWNADGTTLFGGYTDGVVRVWSIY